MSSTGNKNELMERLQEALKAKTEDAASATSVDELEEDLLNVCLCLFLVVSCVILSLLKGDDDEHLDSTESVITDIDTANEVIQKGIKRKSTEKESEEELPKPAKKIVLKRNSSHTEETSQPELVEIKILEKAEKKVIKLSEIGAKEVSNYPLYYCYIFDDSLVEVRNESKEIWGAHHCQHKESCASRAIQ